MYYDCTYSPIDGSFARKANYQVENTPAVIYSIGDSRVLNWKKEILLIPNGQMIQYFLNRMIMIGIPSLLLIN